MGVMETIDPSNYLNYEDAVNDMWEMRVGSGEPLLISRMIPYEALMKPVGDGTFDSYKMECIKYDCIEWKEGYHEVDFGSKNLGTSVRLDPITGKQMSCMAKSSCEAWKTKNGDEYRYKDDGFLKKGKMRGRWQ